MRISDWSSDVCSSDLEADALTHLRQSEQPIAAIIGQLGHSVCALLRVRAFTKFRSLARNVASICGINSVTGSSRSEEHTSELQSLMCISYAVFCLKKKKNNNKYIDKNTKSYNII